ncbi:Premnaspirodiene oxygenase [Ananas comosus]|uniref:Premnaspirodiene oxygenase n=1 Tax=Ananas comosus TaxID=4615 RepID=A0A199V9Z7_ANACO|nr:Premnaspirodiene oxygenase [Ananas comosus]
MEFLYLFLLLTFLLLVLLVLRRRGLGGGGGGSRKKAVVPPGPWELPVVGSLHHLAGKLPHHSLRDLSRRYGQLMLLRFGEVPTLVASSPEAAREIMKAHDVAFADRPVILAVQIMSYGNKGIIFAPYGHYWRELRKLCILELLSAKRVLSFRSIREEEVHNLVRSINQVTDSVVNLSGKLFALMNDITIRTIVGDKCKQQDVFLAALSKSVEAAGGFNMVDLFPSSTLARLFCGIAAELKKTHRRFDDVLDDIIREHVEIMRRKERGSEEDLLDVLLRIREEGFLQFPLPIESIKAIILDLFGAGSETSSTTVEWAMSELVRNPSVMKKAQSEVREVFGARAKVTEADLKELSYLKLVVKEALRLHPPVPLLLPRECREPCRVLGYDIPEKTRVLVNVWAMGRDPQIWDDAEEFKPERFDESAVDFKGTDFQYLPFGAGRRICPGMSYGLANAEIALAGLLFYFDWEIPDGAQPSQLDMTEAFGVTARRKSDLRLLAIPRFPCPVADK